MDDEELQTQIEALRARRKETMDKNPTALQQGENLKLDSPKKADRGIGDIILFQSILAVLLVIIFICANMTSKPQAQFFLNQLKEKLCAGFSFQEQVYDVIGDAITYLNTLSPIVAEEKGAGGIFTPSGNKLPANATFAPVIYTGAIQYPIDSDNITSDFGFRINPIVKKSDFHNALDIAAPKGTAIFAAVNGIVIESRYDASLGNYIKIQHGNGFITTYAHCDKLIAAKDMRVRKGEVIARVGSTGASTGPHLHFAAQKDNMYFDPQYLFDSTLALAL